MRRTFAPLAALVSVLSFFAAPAAQAQSFDASKFSIYASASANSAPEYLGSDNYKFGFKPEFDVTWDRAVFLSSENGLGLYLLNTPAGMPSRTKVAMSVMRDSGRESSSNADLFGTENVGSTLQARFMSEYTTGMFTVGGVLRQSMTNDRGDRTASLYLTLTQPLMTNLTGYVTGSTTWASREYMQRYFGINSAEATASGLPAFAVGNGFRDLTLASGVSYAINDSGISLDGRLKWTHLIGDAADSPLTKDADQFSATVGIAYRYN